MNRKKILPVFTALIAVIILVTSLVYFYFLTKKNSGELATLYIESGEVYLRENIEDVYTLIDTDKKDIRDKTHIKTNDGYGHVIFPNGSVMSLEANTEVEISFGEDGVSIFQFIGNTWHRVEKLLVSEAYEVETSNTLAAVRGTSFGVSNINGDSTLVVITENDINVSKKIIDSEGLEKILDTLKLVEGEQIKITDLDELIKSKITDDTKNSEWYQKHKQLDENSKEVLRKMIKDKSLGTFNDGEENGTDSIIDGIKDSIRDLFQGSKLELVIVEPVEGLVIRSDQVLVKGEVSKDAEITINGLSIKATNGKFEYLVKLNTGQNKINIVAKDKDGISVEKTIFVTRKETDNITSPTSVPIKPTSTLKPTTVPTTPNNSSQITLYSDPTDSGVYFWWKVSGNPDASKGFKLLKSTKSNASL